jgi:hypothetical protein
MVTYHVMYKGFNEGETRIECELQLGDYCSIELDHRDVELKVIKRTYYPIVMEWLFWCELEIEDSKNEHIIK